MTNPSHEADMLRRCATAARNRQAQVTGDKEWFNWVPAYLDNLADRLGAMVLNEALSES